MLGLAVYLLYALRTPPEQAESAKHRAGVTPFMLIMAVLAILCYAAYGFLLVTGRLLRFLRVDVQIKGIMTTLWLAVLLTVAHGALVLGFDVLAA